MNNKDQLALTLVSISANTKREKQDLWEDFKFFSNKLDGFEKTSDYLLELQGEIGMLKYAIEQIQNEVYKDDTSYVDKEILERILRDL